MKSGLLSYNGVPGSGKTLHAVYDALKHYKKENSLFFRFVAYVKYLLFKNNLILGFSNYLKCNKLLQKILNLEIVIFIKKLILGLPFIGEFIKHLFSCDYEYYSLFPHKRINNVYSTFPILLDKKRNIWSNKLSLYDLIGDKSFLPNALLIIDEVQLFADSDEYRDKNRNKILSKVAKFLQSHRHFGIKKIIFTSQNPSRIFKKARNIVTWYVKQKKIINIPIIPISIMRGIAYEDFEYYGRFIPRDREERKKLPFDYRKITIFFNRYKVFNAYDSRYLSPYNYSRPLMYNNLWSVSKVDDNHLTMLFEDSIE